MISINLFGKFSVTDESGNIVQVTGAKSQGLFV